MAEFGKMSPSRLNDLNCRRYYRFKHVDKEPADMNIRFAFGIAIHQMLSWFYSKNFQSEDTFIGYWGHYWGMIRNGENKRIGNVYVYSPDPERARPYILGAYKKRGEKILRRFYHRHKPKPDPIAVEKRFDIEFEGFELTGRIDRIDEFKGGLIATDYKTSKKLPEENDLLILKDPQFTIYYLGLKGLYNEEPNGVFMYHLMSGKIIPVPVDDTNYEDLLDALKKSKVAIETDDFEKNTGLHCYFCDYYYPCRDEEVREYPDSEELKEEIELFWGDNL